MIDGVSVEELAALIEGTHEARVPDGFYPDKKGKGAALRCQVPLIANENTELPTFEEAEPVVTEAVGHLLDLVDWLEAGGAQMLLGRPEPAIAHHFDFIATLAQRAGKDDLATMASEQAMILRLKRYSSTLAFSPNDGPAPGRDQQELVLGNALG